MDERLRRFLGKEKKYEKDGEVFILKPFKTKDIDLFTGMGENLSGEDIVKLVSKALNDAGFSVTEDDVRDMEVPFVNWLAECIADVNGLTNYRPKDNI